MLLEEASLDCTIRPVDFSAGGQFAPEFLVFLAKFVVTKKGKHLLFDRQQPVSLQGGTLAGRLVP